MSTPTPPPGPPPGNPDFTPMTAPLLFGQLLNMFFFGVLTVQFYLYYITFPNDPTYIKSFVYSVFTIDTAATFMSIADAYHWFAAGFGKPERLNEVHLSSLDTPMMGAWIAAAAQSFYAYRIYKINPKIWPVCALIGTIALAEVIAGFYGGIVGTKSKLFSVAGGATLPAIYIVFIGAAVADVIIVVTMILLLAYGGPRHHQRSTFVLTKILNLTVETNILSTTLAVLTMILLVGIPNSNYFVTPSYILGKIYSNSLLLMLNNRHYLASGLEHNTDPSSDRVRMTNFTTNFQDSRIPKEAASIHIDVDTEATNDREYSSLRESHDVYSETTSTKQGGGGNYWQPGLTPLRRTHDG